MRTSWQQLLVGAVASAGMAAAASCGNDSNPQQAPGPSGGSAGTAVDGSAASGANAAAGRAGAGHGAAAGSGASAGGGQGGAAGSGASAGGGQGGAGGGAGAAGSLPSSCEPACGGTEQCLNGTCQPLTLDGIQFYPSDYIWNVPVDTLPVHPMSDTYLGKLHPEGFIYLATSFPINVVNSSQPKQSLTSIEYNFMSDNVPIPIPDHPGIENAGSDHHMFIIDRDTNLDYELYNVVQASNGTWSASSFTVFDQSSYTLRPHGVDAAGLPMVPGLIRFDEIVAKVITHATRFAAYVSYGDYVWPAQAGSPVKDSTNIPFGQRVRLKQSFSTSGFSERATIILDSWKKYGIVYADNYGGSEAWILSAEADPGWADNYALFNDLKKVHGSDFECVDATALMIAKDSGQARVSSP
jgi:hypothetical protein